MPSQEAMAEAAGRHLVRTAIREYAKFTLFAPPPRTGSHDPLTLPRKSRPGVFTEEDVYTSRPGAQDRKRLHQEGDPDVKVNFRDQFVDILIPYSGLNDTESLANAAMGSIGPMAQQLRHPTESYRAYLARELRDAATAPAPLFIEHVRVYAAFERLGARYKTALRDLDQSHPERLSPRGVARKWGLSERQVREWSAAAIDALAAMLYALYDVRSAA